MINLLNEELEIQKQHELERYKAYEEACTEVNKYLIEKQKEASINYIEQNFSSIKKQMTTSEKPIISDDGKYVTPCSKQGVSPFDLK